jgi:hypothetical protein
MKSRGENEHVGVTQYLWKICFLSLTHVMEQDKQKTAKIFSTQLKIITGQKVNR